MSNTSFPQMVLQARKEKGMTQKQLSEASNIPVDTIRMWEQGRNSMTIDNADKVFKALGVSITIGKEETT